MRLPRPQSGDLRRGACCLIGDTAMEPPGVERPAAVLRCPRSTGTSAAQNGPVIRICPKCGALLLDDTESCSFCEVSAAEKKGLPGRWLVEPGRYDEILEPVAAGKLALSPPRRAEGRASGAREVSESPEPEWRLEVSRRLEQYRARRGRLRPDDSQSGLPFREAPADPEIDDELCERRPALSRAEGLLRPAQRQRPAERRATRKIERVEICIQPELDFSSAPDDRAHPQTALVPVASLAERRWAGALDALFLGFTCAGFVGLFRSLGGVIALEQMDAIVCLAVAYLFYALYISLFTTLAGATPGMQLRGLTIVRLDGSLPDTRQLLWRSFGYLLSGATLLLGFLWAMWDEDRFTWQDRISQTYVTAAAPLSAFDTLDLTTR
jgi:uncharacterized RDD family membrane protein YckC